MWKKWRYYIPWRGRHSWHRTPCWFACWRVPRHPRGSSCGSCLLTPSCTAWSQNWLGWKIFFCCVESWKSEPALELQTSQFSVEGLLNVGWLTGLCREGEGSYTLSLSSSYFLTERAFCGAQDASPPPLGHWVRVWFCLFTRIFQSQPIIYYILYCSRAHVLNPLKFGVWYETPKSVVVYLIVSVWGSPHTVFGDD